jgi:hypothetical protein
MSVGGQEFKVTPGTTISLSTFLHGDLTNGSYCETGMLELSRGRKIGGQAIYEIMVLEEYTKLNDLTGTITVASGISANLGDLSLTDLVEGTYVWTHLDVECPWTLVQLYRGPIKIFSNHSSTLEGGLALMEDRAKEQVARIGVGDHVSVVLELCPPHPHPQHRCLHPPGPQDGGGHRQVQGAASQDGLD